MRTAGGSEPEVADEAKKAAERGRNASKCVAFGCEEMPLAIPESLWRQPPEVTEAPKERGEGLELFA